MATPEEIELAKESKAAIIEREDPAFATNALALTGDNSGVPDVNLDFTDQAPMVVEGQLPPLVSTAEAEQGQYIPAAASEASGAWGAFPTQDQVDAIVSDMNAQDQPFVGPLLETPKDLNLSTSPVAPISEQSTYRPPIGSVYSSGAGTAPKIPGSRRTTKTTRTRKTTKRTLGRDREIAKGAAIGARDVSKALLRPHDKLDITGTSMQIVPGLTPEEQLNLRTEGGTAKIADIPLTELAQRGQEQRGQLPTAQDPYQELIDIKRQQGDLYERQGAEQARLIQGYQNKIANLNDSKAESRRVRMEELDTQFEHLKTATSEIKNLKVDRNRWWNSRTTGQKIAAAISLMISGYQHGYAGRGGIAPMLSMMLKAIDDDVADQVRTYNSKKGDLGRQQNLYGLFRQRLGDHDNSVIATKSELLDQLKMDLESSKLKTNSAEKKLQIEEQIENIRLAQKGLLSGYGTTPKEVRAIRKEGRDIEDHYKKTLTNVKRGGKFLSANNPTSAKAADEVEAARKSIARQISRMKVLIGEHDWEFFDILGTQKLTQELKQLRHGLATNVAKIANNGGKISDQDVIRAESRVPDITSIFSFSNALESLGWVNSTLHSLDALGNIMEDNAQTTLKSLLPEYTSAEKAADIRLGSVKGRGK